MPNNVLAILIDDLGWRMALTADGKPDVRPLAEGDGLPDPSRIAAELRQAGYRGQPLVLAIPTAWCLAAPFSTAGLPRRAGSDLLRFRLEEKLPTPMEELAADVAMRGNTALGVAVPLARVQPVVEALEKEGVVVQWIVPSALAAARAMVEPVRAARSSESASILLIQTKNHIDLVALRDGVPWAWRLTAARPNDVLLHFNSLLIEVIGSPQVKLIGVDDSIRDAVTAGLSDVESSGDPVEHVVVDAVQQYVSGRRSPWIDLRRGNLAAPDSLRLVRRPLAIALSAACLLLATLCGVMLWRAAQYEQQAQTLQQQQAGVFRQVFSTGSVPPNPRMRLESEHRALQGRSGQSTDLPRQPSALTRFQEALSRLPTDLRYRIVEIRVEGDRIYMDGQARAHGDADRIAVTLRLRQGFTVEPPRTENLRDGRGVSFTLTAVALAPFPETPASPPSSPPIKTADVRSAVDMP